MSVDIGYELLVGSAISADKKSEITSRVLQVLQSETLSIVYATTYSAGSSDTNQATITIGTSINFAIRIIMDKTVVGDKKVADILQRLISVLLTESIALTHKDDYVDGSRVYNITITVT